MSIASRVCSTGSLVPNGVDITACASMNRCTYFGVLAPREQAVPTTLFSLKFVYWPTGMGSQVDCKAAVLHVRRAKKGTLRKLQAYLGHKNIQHTVRYPEMAPNRCKDFWR
jgi:hypothetical protein